MPAEKGLSKLLRSMRPRLHDEVFVFATTTDTDNLATLEPLLRFVEEEGTTLVLKKDQAETHGLQYEFPCRMITLSVHSSLDAVGFIAAVTTHLAKESISVNTVSAYFHDHLFVPADRAEDAMISIGELSGQSS